MNEIELLENSIASLPKGSITKKVIQGKERYYLQWREGDKVKSRYIKGTELPELSAQIARRKELQQKVIELQVDSIQQSLAGVFTKVAADSRSSYMVEPYDFRDRMVNFLLSMDKGFCLEARARQLPLNGPDLSVDWVFYNRILHCHVLVNLKDCEFRKSNLDQLGVCVKYYRDHVMQPGDNPPVGILLSTRKGAKMVEFAASCVSRKDFDSIYKPLLPAKHQLMDFMAKCDLLKG